MLDIAGSAFASCDRVPRRNFLRIGSLSLAGLTLPQLLKLRADAAEQGNPVRDTSVIYVELAGGPTQIETYDPKPEAPADYRGPLGIVKTTIPGVNFSQMMEQQAKSIDKLAVLRAIHHDSSSHRTSAHLAQTGYYLRDRQNNDNEMPCVGSITSRLRGSRTAGLPAFVSLQRAMRFGNAAYIGKAYNPFVVNADPSRKDFRVNNLGGDNGLQADRLDDRKRLLQQVDALRQLRDQQGASQAIDRFTDEAFQMVTSGAARKAFDIEAEHPAIREQYGNNRTGQEFLLARRLIEAGVTFVTIRVGGWDDHNQIVRRLNGRAPYYDRAMAALVNDLSERGLDRDVLVVAMGEFGRTPKVNRTAGRDHWGRLMSVLIAGGGLQMGQIVGSSNSKGEVPRDLPYRPENVLAMVYRHLGIDPHQTIDDLSGRPRYLLEEAQLIPELI